MTLVNVQNNQIKNYGKLPAEEAEEIPWNKILIDLIGHYIIQRNGKKKEILRLKAIAMIDPVTGWFEISQYENKRVISNANLVETTWLSRYPKPIEITYDSGKEFIGHEFIKYLIEMEYRIATIPITLGNYMSNSVLGSINQVIGNLVRTFNISGQTYVEKNEL